MPNGTIRAYTHIVVGAGSAGCVVTARIAENPHFNVLLLEAGPDLYDGSDSVTSQSITNARKVPMKGQTDVYSPTIDWGVKVQLSNGKSMIVPQAKLVGGGSAINGGTALRNSRADCNEWQRLGNNAWGFGDTVPVYDSLENDPVRGTRGPHPISRATERELGKIQKAFVLGAQEVGFKYTADQNGPDAEGISPSPVCRRGDQRISLSNTFLDPIRSNDNIKVISKAVVDRILFDQQTPQRAIGVLLADGTELQANTEVVLCAGAVFSPAILQRSGVGPQTLLSYLGIPVVSSLPSVGSHLQDHPCIPLTSRPKNASYLNGDFSLQCNARWSSEECPGAIDLQLVCFSYLYIEESISTGERGLGGVGMNGHVAGIGCNVNKATSTGTVLISTRDPNRQPDIKPNYLGNEKDKQLAREAVRRGWKVLNSPFMCDVLERPGHISEEIVSSDALLDGFIEAQYTSTYHFTSTCRMASREHGGVVDQSGRLYTVKGVRIADASVLPTIPSANTMWPTVMFAERIGRSIRDGKDIGTHV